MARTIIGFSGRKQSGKTTAAKHLMQSGYAGLSFAHSIRSMLRGLFLCLGYAAYEIEAFMYEDKEQLIPLIGKSFRQMMQTLGIEWGRELINPDLWVMAARAQIERYGSNLIVFDDVRFENEAALIRELGGLIIHIDRGDLVIDEHSSEAGINDHPDDMFIDNDQSLDEFLKDVDLVVARHINA